MVNDDRGIVGAILAGGLSRRMGGGDKGLRELGGKTVLAWVAECARPQVDHLLLNANGDPARFDGLGLSVLADRLSGHQGPLAGLLTALDWVAETHPEAAWLATFPGDAPFFPADLVVRLTAAAGAAGAPAACAASAGRRHPVFGVWRPDLRGALRRFLVDEGRRRVEDWVAACGALTVDFPPGEADPFFNINRAEDLDEAERRLLSRRA